MPNLLSTLTLNIPPATEGSLTLENGALSGNLPVNSEGSTENSGFSLLFTQSLQSLDQASNQLATWIKVGDGTLPDLTLPLPLAGNMMPQEGKLDLPAEALETLPTAQQWLAALPIATMSADVEPQGVEVTPTSISLNLEGGKHNSSQLLRHGMLPALVSGQAASTAEADAAIDPELVLTLDGNKGVVSQSTGKALDQVVSQLLLGDRTAGQDGKQGAKLAEVLTAIPQTNAAPMVTTPTNPISASSGLGTAFSIDIPPGQSGWNEALGEKLTWLFQNNRPSAQVRLNPPHLGPLEIKVAMTNDQANVTFTVHHQVTADHLESALPRLREMLAESGLQLAQFDVRQQGQDAQERDSGEAAEFDLDTETAATTGEEGEGVTTSLTTGNGLLDTYA